MKKLFSGWEDQIHCHWEPEKTEIQVRTSNGIEVKSHHSLFWSLAKKTKPKCLPLFGPSNPSLSLFFFFFLTQIISSLSQSHALKFISLCPLSFATVHSRHLRVLYDFTLNPLPYASPTFSSLLALCLIHTL